ncbi:MAG: LptF/LptG family permease [Roseibacillus sp.]|nr:LptF/LptG family permease [Roseibacillus sp.]
MRIADRYIGWQVLYGTIFGVSLLTVVLILGQVFRKIRPLLVEQAAPLDLIGRFILLIIPFTLMFTLPWGFLASTLLSFGRLSSHNELLGLRMAGLGLGRVALPVILVGAGLSGLCWWLTGTAAPRAKNASRNLIYEAVRKDPRKLIQPRVVISRFPNQRVYAEGADEDGLIHGLHIYKFTGEGGGGSLEAYMFAQEVDLYVNEEEKQLRLKLSNPFIEISMDQNETSPIPIRATEMEPVLIDFSATGKKKNKPSDITNADAPVHIAESQARQDICRRELSGELPPRPAGLPSGAEFAPAPDENDLFPAVLTPQRIEELEKTIQKEDRFQKELNIELHKRRSLSMSCFSFAMIGIPLGISARRRETSNGFLLSLFIAAIYFGLLIFAQQIEDAHLPTIITVLWLPNALCLILGFWLFRRASFR